MNRFTAIAGVVLLLASLNAAAVEETAVDKATVAVYRSPTCRCCGRWIQHLKENHFAIKDIVTHDLQAIKQQRAVPEHLASCHTAVVDGYVIEGHVPASDIEKLLRTRPNVVGIAAPGMPLGSPGMEVGGRQDDYVVVSFDSEGHYEVFTEHQVGK